MDAYRALYVVAANTKYGRWVRQFWQGQSPRGDPLWKLLHPDQRGEVEAWGPWPHWTILDALTMADPEAFADVVKAVCCIYAPVMIKPTGVAIYNNRTALVVECSCPALRTITRHLMDATRHLIARTPLSDEAWQKAEWVVKKTGNDTKGHLDALHGARKAYREAGAPPLPTSRHFRLGFLVRLWKQLTRATGAPKRRSAARHLEYFLKYGEPHWYSHGGSLHITIASGLDVKSSGEEKRRLRDYSETIWPMVQQKLKAYHPQYLAIMGEDPRRAVTVHFYDWLTEQFIKETRPGFKIVDRACFARPD